MSIEFYCPCGQRYVVADSKVGKTATCSGCMGQLTVPASSEEAVAALPPKRKRRRPPEADLRPVIIDEEQASAAKPEMHIVVVVLIAIVLLLNGRRALGTLVLVPIAVHLHAVISKSESADPEQDTAVGTLASSVGIILVLGLGYLTLAASMAGLLFWRGYALYFAVGASLLLFVFQFLIGNFVSLIQFNVVAMVAIVLLLRSLDPAVWKRLMASA